MKLTGKQICLECCKKQIIRNISGYPVRTDYETMIAVKTAAVIFYTAVSDVLDNKYVFWIITTAVGLLVGALTWFVKRAIDKMEKRIDEQEDKLNKTINDLPFLYTLRLSLIHI